MGRSLIRCAGFALLFASGVFIGSKTIMAAGTILANGKCSGKQACTSLGGAYGGGTQFSQCPTGQCDFSTQITTGNYIGCIGPTPNGCNVIVPTKTDTCSGGCVNQLGTPCSVSWYECQ
jgi:hypothetical protein